MNKPIIFALDFDGVICDSAVETAYTGWKAATTIWQDMPTTVPQRLVDQFRLVRPLIETGYEAILAMRMLYQQESIDTIYAEYDDKKQALKQEANITVSELKALLGKTRDELIESDLPDWINKNALYLGIVEKLQKLGQRCPWYVVTTKHERFVKLILNANAISLPAERIFGLDRQLSKADVLTQLQSAHPNDTLFFVEDRLPTLLTVKEHGGLEQLQLGLATWGYNTDQEKVLAAEQGMALLQLDDFLIP